MKDKIEELFGIETPSETEEVTPVETTEEATPEVVESTEEPTETEATTEQTPPEEVQPERQEAAPIAAVTMERQRRQEAERQALEAQQNAYALQQQLQQLQTQQQQQSSRPDPFDNPDEYDAHVQRLVAQQVQNALVEEQARQMDITFRASKAKVEAELGEETANEAISWAHQVALQNEAWGKMALAQPDPVRWIVEQKTRHAQFEEYQRDPDGFIARLAAERGIGTATVADPVVQQADPIKAPKSLAGTGSSAATKPSAVTDKEWMDSLFNNKR